MGETKNIQAELDSLVKGTSWPRTYPASQPPEDYFGALPGLVLERLQAADEETTVPRWSRETPYVVPEGYFRQLPGRVMRQVSPAAPVVSLPRRRQPSRWSAWSAAATITVIIAFSGLLWFGHGPATPSAVSIDQQLASLSSEAIEQYLNTATNTLNTDELLNTLNSDQLQEVPSGEFSSQDLEDYLNEEIPDSLY